MKPDRRHAPPWPVVLLVKALNATVIFFFYTIWGYRLPPRPEAADVLAWNKQHGSASYPPPLPGPSVPASR